MYTAKGKLDQDALIKQYLPVVRRHALSMQVKLPASIELDDLIQAGVIGLIEAMGRFDTGVGASFETFASQRIRGSMIDELRTRDWMPRSVRRKAREMAATVRSLEQTLGRPPSEAEIADSLDMDISEYRQLLNDTNSGQLLPLDDLISKGREPEFDDEGAEADGPYDSLLDNQQRGNLINAIENLPDREKLLMTLYYQEEMNLKEIGVIMGVTESRVCQLHSQAISRLRGKLQQ
ncbi:MAG: RNA polymerase sigma factor FliA [Porticoccus sp.]|nr:RNA polymerase sigma factor FliA [Porticoccus sp.]MBQ0807318.1 RNA polymerase sigma factor FliA [Porticoccus sp.]MDX2349962.1 RNA polymerase sigma factor FliA [Porticoccus sp.]